MRWCALLAALWCGCSFDVIGTNVDDPGTPAGSAPTQSIPSGPGTTPTEDLGMPTPPNGSPTPPSTMPDMARQRVGTPCKSNGDCDAGLTCATTFFVGLTRIDVPGGYCTEDCSAATVTCPTDSYCGSFSFGKFCLSSCPPDPCRKDYECCANNGAKACLPGGLCPPGKDG